MTSRRIFSTYAKYAADILSQSCARLLFRFCIAFARMFRYNESITDIDMR